MNRRLCVWIGSVLGCVMCWYATGGETAAAASAVTPVAAPPTLMVVAPPPPLSPEIFNAAGTVTTANAAAIAAFVVRSVDALGTPASAAAARAGLIAACPRGSSTDFHDVYTAALNKAVLAAIGRGASMPAKINFGVVMTTVGTAANTSGMEPAVDALLGDRNDGVVLAGIHAAQPLVVTLITQPSGPGNTKVFAAVVNAVKTHALGDFAGFIATDAYRTLVVKPDNVPNIGANAVRPLLKPLYTPVMNLLAARLATYAKSYPPSPNAEAIVPTFFTRDYTTAGYWTGPQKARAAQELDDLISSIGQRAGAVTDRTYLDQMRDTASVAAQGLDVIGGASVLTSVAHLPPGVTAAALATGCTGAHATIQLNVKTLTPPPTLPPASNAAPVAPVAPAPASPGRAASAGSARPAQPASP